MIAFLVGHGIVMLGRNMNWALFLFGDKVYFKEMW